ncbi:hypothetical protein B6U74_00980 [Candidatus Bathyarchaeota archaeon ex4484_205]|nr:MAG: hypothetical protein B6U74_00980 [Candidatus Bathyarchaeota archaeon ex4484_205]
MLIKEKIIRKENRYVASRVLYRTFYELIVNEDRCRKCLICKNACPFDAIDVKKGELSINVSKCTFCGICEALCPFNAITLYKNGEKYNPVVELERFPRLVREVRINIEKCPEGCTECAEACPLGLIEITWEGRKPRIEIQEAECPGCELCVDACPVNAISVKRSYYGEISIESSKCPPDCEECIKVCPLKIIHREGGEVRVDETHCIYCAACVDSCPEEAISCKLTWIKLPLIKSGALLKIFERFFGSSGKIKLLNSWCENVRLRRVEEREIV